MSFWSGWRRSWRSCRARFAMRWRSAIRSIWSPGISTCSDAHGVAHVYNAWARMPELGTQLRIPQAATADFTVSRALLRRGRPYEQAVKAFAPYDRTARPESGGARGAAGTGTPRPGEPSAGIPVREQPAGGQCAGDHPGGGSGLRSGRRECGAVVTTRLQHGRVVRVIPRHRQLLLDD